MDSPPSMTSHDTDRRVLVTSPSSHSSLVRSITNTYSLLFPNFPVFYFKFIFPEPIISLEATLP